MGFSAFAARLRAAFTVGSAKRALLLAAGAAIVGAGAAQAQQSDAPQRWGVNPTPQTSADGRETSCVLWYGRSPQPLVQIWLAPDRLRLNLGATELAGGSGGQVQAGLQFPRGQTATITAAHGDGVISIGLTERSLETVLNELRHNGEFVITVNAHSFSFPVNNISKGVDILQNCRRQLPGS